MEQGRWDTPDSRLSVWQNAATGCGRGCGSHNGRRAGRSSSRPADAWASSPGAGRSTCTPSSGVSSRRFCASGRIALPRDDEHIAHAHIVHHIAACAGEAVPALVIHIRLNAVQPARRYPRKGYRPVFAVQHRTKSTERRIPLCSPAPHGPSRWRRLGTAENCSGSPATDAPDDIYPPAGWARCRPPLLEEDLPGEAPRVIVTPNFILYRPFCLAGFLPFIHTSPRRHGARRPAGAARGRCGSTAAPCPARAPQTLLCPEPFHDRQFTRRGARQNAGAARRPAQGLLRLREIPQERGARYSVPFAKYASPGDNQLCARASAPASSSGGRARAHIVRTRIHDVRVVGEVDVGDAVEGTRRSNEREPVASGAHTHFIRRILGLRWCLHCRPRSNRC